MKKKWTGILGLAFFVGGLLIALFFASYDYLRGDIYDDFGFVQERGVYIGIGLFLLGGHFGFTAFWKYLFLILFTFGTFLLSLNIYGEFVSLRNPRINEGIPHFNKLRIPQESPEQVFQQIDKRQDESVEEYAYRLTELVYSATVHKWEDVNDYSEFNHQIPPYENYFLWAQSFLHPNDRSYQFCDPYKAIERGVMICSQVTEAMTKLWTKTGLEVRNMVLEGHVVAEVEMNHEHDIWWVLDADFGVVLEHDIKTLEEHPEIVVEKYVNAGYNEEIATRIADFYGKEGNYVQSNPGICRVEERLYRRKWTFPLELLAASTIYFGWVWLKKRRLLIDRTSK
jgi:hypothetical protein